MSEEQVQAQPAPLDQSRVPINSENFHLWLERIKSRYEADEAVRKMVGEDIIEAVNLAMAIVQPFINDASINVVNDPDSFKLAAKRKIMGVSTKIKARFDEHMQKCTDAINELQHMKLDENEKLSSLDKRLQETVKECLQVIRKSRLFIVTYIIAMDHLAGSLTANLPEDLIPNALKGRVGYFSR
ncbi:MAG: hypothetical protein GXO43_04240 [Crenarchaeota archaeon]|nr:hypothetical protein [Thermoproteota archaeon]